MANIKCSRNASFAFFLLSLIIFIVAFATPHWFRWDGVYNHGLWRICTEDVLFFTDDCYKIKDTESEINATRALMCIALVCYVASFISYCIWMSQSPSYLRESGAGPSGKAALAMALIGGIFSLIGVIVFGVYYTDDDLVDGLQWSFIMAAISTAVMVLNSTITLGVTACCFESSAPVGGSTPIGQPPTTMTIITTTQPQSGQVPPQTQTGYPPQPGYPTQSNYPPQPNYPPQQAYPPQGYPNQQYSKPGQYPPPPSNMYPQQPVEPPPYATAPPPISDQKSMYM